MKSRPLGLGCKFQRKKAVASSRRWCFEPICIKYVCQIKSILEVEMKKMLENTSPSCVSTPFFVVINTTLPGNGNGWTYRTANLRWNII